MTTITTTETMHILGLSSTKAVSKLLKQGKIKGHKPLGRWFVDKESVLAYKRQREMGQQFTSTTNAAEILGMSVSHVTRLCQSGILESKKEGGRWKASIQSVYRYKSRDIDRYGRGLCAKCKTMRTRNKIDGVYTCAKCRPKKKPSQKKPIVIKERERVAHRPVAKVDYSAFRKRAQIPEHMLP